MTPTVSTTKKSNRRLSQYNKQKPVSFFKLASKVASTNSTNQFKFSDKTAYNCSQIDTAKYCLVIT